MPRAVGRGRRRQSTPTFEPPDFRAGRGLLQTVGMLADTLCAAINAHDIDAFMACFDEDYDSVQPVHPGREFHGPDQVRRNWTALFREVPDVRAEVLAKTEASGVEWAEWHWHGTRSDGSIFQMRGMTIGGTRNG